MPRSTKLKAETILFSILHYGILHDFFILVAVDVVAIITIRTSPYDLADFSVDM
jgi:hypothetical protein